MPFTMSKWEVCAGSNWMGRTSFSSGLQMVPVISPSAFCSFQLMLVMQT